MARRTALPTCRGCPGPSAGRASTTSTAPGRPARPVAAPQPPIHVSGPAGDATFTVSLRHETLNPCSASRAPGARTASSRRATARGASIPAPARLAHVSPRPERAALAQVAGRNGPALGVARGRGRRRRAERGGRRVPARARRGEDRPSRSAPEPEHMRRIETWAAVLMGARFTGEAARVDAERFARVYAPVGILPPDQYLTSSCRPRAGARSCRAPSATSTTSPST